MPGCTVGLAACSLRRQTKNGRTASSHATPPPKCALPRPTKCPPPLPPHGLVGETTPLPQLVGAVPELVHHPPPNELAPMERRDGAVPPQRQEAFDCVDDQVHLATGDGRDELPGKGPCRAIRVEPGERRELPSRIPGYCAIVVVIVVGAIPPVVPEQRDQYAWVQDLIGQVEHAHQDPEQQCGIRAIGDGSDQQHVEHGGGRDRIICADG